MAPESEPRLLPTFAWVDVETTGLHHDRRAWDVAVIRQAPGEQLQEWQAFVASDDLDLAHAELKGLQVGRFHARHPEFDGVPRAPIMMPEVALRRDGFLPDSPRGTRSGEEVAWEVERLTRDAILVGNNVAFDAEVLAALLRRHGLAPAWHYRVVDVVALGAARLATHLDLLDHQGPQVPEHAHDAEQWRARAVKALVLPWRSEQLSLACGVELPTEAERHSALGDARWAYRWWRQVAEHPMRLP